ncbi:hypothetical protein HOA92_01270 [archaeon]|jgi:hypothetical protein|nr:hypothetical protein [archaeon]MBT6761648.1 hypothetical protein [archaeon]
MTNIHHQVHTILTSDRAIQKNLQRDLINSRALARYLQDQGVDGTIDAIISAIRRFENQKNNNFEEKNLKKYLQSMIITTKNNILLIELKDAEFLSICKDYLSKNILKKNFRLIKGKEQIKIFMNQKDYDAKKKIFQAKNIKSSIENLAEIRLTFPKENKEVVGLLARIGLELSLEGVNIQGIIESIPEILLYVNESDLLAAHKAMISLKK